MLSNMICGRLRAPLKTLIYGAEGIGKSTFCAHPGTAWICAENGTAHLDVDRFPPATSWQDLLNNLNQLENEPHNYWAVVVDSIDWAQMLAAEYVARKENKSSIEMIPFGRGWGMVADCMIDLIRSLERLERKGMDIYMISHSEITQFDDPGGDSYNRWTPSLHKKVRPLFKEYADCVLFATEDSYTTLSGEGLKARQVGKSSGKRIMFTEHRPAYDAKNRYQLPHKMPLDHNTYRMAISEYFNKETAQ